MCIRDSASAGAIIDKEHQARLGCNGYLHGIAGSLKLGVAGKEGGVELVGLLDSCAENGRAQRVDFPLSLIHIS